MNLEKEMKEVGSTSKESLEVVYDLCSQKNEIARKIHMFSILSFARGLVELTNSGILDLHDISGVSFRHYRDHESGMNNLSFSFVDLKDQLIEPEVIDEKHSEVYCSVNNLVMCSGLYCVDGSFINQEFKEDGWMSVSLLKNTENETLDLFLNKELRSALEFNKLKLVVKDGNVSQKKPKL